MVEAIPSNVRDSKDGTQSKEKVSRRWCNDINTDLRSPKVLVSSTAVSAEFTNTGVFL